MEIAKHIESLEFELWRRWRLKVSNQVSNELTNNELDYLYALNSLDTEVSLSLLAEQMNVSRASASNMVSKLETKGYIAKIKSSGDGRGVKLVATPKTVALRHLEHDIYKQVEAAFQGSLSEKEYDQFAKLLSKAVDALTTQDNTTGIK